jgi:septal ring factor EnvC (AmiA/AmiB activator)
MLTTGTISLGTLAKSARPHKEEKPLILRLRPNVLTAFGMAQCKMAKDYYWTVESGDREVDLANKRLQMTDAEMEALRKDRMALKDIITLLQRDLKEVKRDRARVRKEAERLANIIHLAEKNAKPRTDRRAKPEEKRPSYVG